MYMCNVMYCNSELKYLLSKGVYLLINNDIVLGKELKEWDESWQCIGLINKCNIELYKGIVGIYKICREDKVLYVGKATENDENRGLRKRLNDYLIDNGSKSTRKKRTTVKINLDTDVFCIIDIGNRKESIIAACYLEQYYIYKLKPVLNKHNMG